MVAAGGGGDLASATDTALLGLVMNAIGLFSIVAGIGFAVIAVMHRVKARGEQAAVMAAATVLCR